MLYRTNRRSAAVVALCKGDGGETCRQGHLVHCVPEAEARPHKYFDSNLHTILKESARKEISKLQDQAGTDFPFSITEGRIAQDAAEVALAHHADLIIAGRGKCQATFGSLRTNLFQILSEAPCPVLSYSSDLEEEVSSRAAKNRSIRAGSLRNANWRMACA